MECVIILYESDQIFKFWMIFGVDTEDNKVALDSVILVLALP